MARDFYASKVIGASLYLNFRIFYFRKSFKLRDCAGKESGANCHGRFKLGYVSARHFWIARGKFYFFALDNF